MADRDEELLNAIQARFASIHGNYFPASTSEVEIVDDPDVNQFGDDSTSEANDQVGLFLTACTT